MRKLPHIRPRGPYHARHSSVTWNLMLGKNLLWTARQHGHSVEVMLRMYAAWTEMVGDSHVESIREAMSCSPSYASDADTETRGSDAHAHSLALP